MEVSLQPPKLQNFISSRDGPVKVQRNKEDIKAYKHENTQADYPTMEQWRKREEDYPADVEWSSSPSFSPLFHGMVVFLGVFVLMSIISVLL